LPGYWSTFFSITTVELVRCGANERLRRKFNDETGTNDSLNTYLAVHIEMLLQVCREYPAIGNFRELTASEIRFFYDGLRAELIESSRPKG
jgi:hypothetical protein